MNAQRKNLYSNLGFDPDELREKYRRERDKRIREDGADQYVEMAGEFAHYAEDDPYVEPGFTREPITDEIDVAIIGGGFSGLLAGARLTERASPTSASSRRAATSAAPGTGTATRARSATSSRTATSRCSKSSTTCRRRSTPSPPRSSSTRNAIGRALRALREDALPDAGAVDRLGRRQQARGTSAPNRDDDIKARFVDHGRSARRPGPSCPASRASTTFEGHSFHTSRWDYDYTGGDTTAG